MCVAVLVLPCPTPHHQESITITLHQYYRTTFNLTDVSNYSDSFSNYFLTSNSTVHSKFLELSYSKYLDKRCDHNVKLTVQSRSQMYQVSLVQCDSFFIQVLVLAVQVSLPSCVLCSCSPILAFLR